MTDVFSEGSGLMTITKKGGSDVEFRTIVETFEQSGGAKDFDSIATINGGRLKNFSPQEDVEVTIEGYAIEIGTLNGDSTGTGFLDLKHGGLQTNSSQPQSITSDHDHSEYRLAVLFTDDTSMTSAASQVSQNQFGERFVYTNGHFTNVEIEYTDNVVKFSVSFKVPPFDKQGNSNVTYESVDGTATLSALSSYS